MFEHGEHVLQGHKTWATCLTGTLSEIGEHVLQGHCLNKGNIFYRDTVWIWGMCFTGTLVCWWWANCAFIINKDLWKWDVLNTGDGVTSHPISSWVSLTPSSLGDGAHRCSVNWVTMAQQENKWCVFPGSATLNIPTLFYLDVCKCMQKPIT